MDIKISDDNKFSLHNNENLVIQIDSTGIKVTNRGEWIRHKLNVKRGSFKIHIPIDIKKMRIISLDVSSEQVHGSQVLPVIIDDITIKQNKMVKMP